MILPGFILSPPNMSVKNQNRGQPVIVVPIPIIIMLRIIMVDIIVEIIIVENEAVDREPKTPPEAVSSRLLLKGLGESNLIIPIFISCLWFLVLLSLSSF